MSIEGPIKGGLNVGGRLEFFGNVQCQLGNKNVSVGVKWSVECRADNSECPWERILVPQQTFNGMRCRPTLILVWMSVSDWKNGPVSGVGNTPFMGPKKPCAWALKCPFLAWTHCPYSCPKDVKGCQDVTLWRHVASHAMIELVQDIPKPCRHGPDFHLRQS